MLELLLTVAVLAARLLHGPQLAVAADDFRETAPEDLSPREAERQLVAALWVAAVTGERHSDMLSIAHHESRYTNTVTHERLRGRWIGDSCGVMTPFAEHERGRRCHSWELTTLGGYLIGALHLKEWRTACRGDRTCALRGYSGGSWDTQNPGLRCWQTFKYRADLVEQAIKKGRR
jgi:hypothetical protein